MFVGTDGRVDVWMTRSIKVIFIIPKPPLFASMDSTARTCATPNIELNITIPGTGIGWKFANMAHIVKKWAIANTVIIIHIIRKLCIQKIK